MSNTFRNSIFPYLVAIAATSAAIVVRLLLDPVLGQTYVFTTLYGAVGVTAWYGGFRPALLSTVVGYVICSVLFQASHAFNFDIALAVGFASFMLTCGIIIGLGVKAGRAEVLYRKKEIERQHVEDELRASERSTRSILESITDSFLTVDSDWRFSYVNPAAERLLERAPGELVSKIMWDEYPEAVGSDIDAMYRRVLANKAAESLTTYYPAHKRWYELRAYPAAADGLAVYFRDVTELKIAESTLRASEERRMLALESAELGAWNIDIASGIMTTDERFVVIFTGATEPLSYEQAVEAIHPDDREQVLEAVAAAIDPLTLAPYAEEYRVVHADGSIHWVFAKGRPNFDEDGEHKKLVSFDGTVSDITDRKKAEYQLQQQSIELSAADRHKNEFLATLAHELRNPLAPMRNVLQIIKHKNFPDPQLAWSIEVLERQLSHVTHLVDDLLDAARITQGRVSLRKSILSLNEIVSNTVDSIKPTITAANQTLKVELPQTPVLLEADPTRLNQIILNLLSNACKYTSPNGLITLTVKTSDAEVMLSVKDNGIGIPADQLSHVFEMFSQLAPALERAEGGLGIGLALVKGLVELHGGRISAYSKGYGQGSEFVLRFPLDPALSSRTGIQADHQLKDPGKRRILLIEDNVDITDTMTVALELFGHEVKAAHDGPSGIQLAQEYRPDVILLDIGLPHMNGFEVAKIIRNSDWGRNIYLVAATGWGQAQDKLNAMEAGFDQHLVKPIDFEALHDILEKSVQ